MVLTAPVWQEKDYDYLNALMREEGLSQVQVQQCKQYIDTLLDWNCTTNITRIITIADSILYHLQDSMRIDRSAGFIAGQTVCDVGSGGGFPGIPLAIKRPDLRYILLEVNQKKATFLRHVIDLLALAHVRVIESDWRTFLRQAPAPVDWFCARASLSMDELMRVFKPSCTYRNAQLIYWASDQWVMQEKERAFFIKKEAYTIGSVRRWYVFFGNKAAI